MTTKKCLRNYCKRCTVTFLFPKSLFHTALIDKLLSSWPNPFCLLLIRSSYLRPIYLYREIPINSHMKSPALPAKTSDGERRQAAWLNTSKSIWERCTTLMLLRFVKHFEGLSRNGEIRKARKRGDDRAKEEGKIISTKRKKGER